MNKSFSRDGLAQLPAVSKTLLLLASVLLLVLVAVMGFEFDRSATVAEVDIVDPSMVDTSAIDPELLYLLQHPLKEVSASVSAVNPAVALPIMISLPVSVAPPAKTSYSFGTAMGAPDEPVVYTLNGERITVDEFYKFQKQLALENFQNRLLVLKLTREQRSKMLESLLTTTDLGNHIDPESWLQENSNDLFVSLNGEQIIALAKASEVSGLKLYHAPTNNTPGRTPSGETSPVLGSAANESISKDFPIDIVLLLSVMILVYLMAYYSLRNLRT